MLIQDNTLQKASLGRRLCAYLIDGWVGIVLSLPAIILFILGTGQAYYYGTLPTIFLYLLAAMLYLLPLFYCLFKDGMRNGQSIGKRVVHLQVVSTMDGTACSYSKSAGRNAMIMLLNLVPLVGWLIEPLLVLIDPEARRVGDKAANTMVVNCNNQLAKPLTTEAPASGILLPLMAATLVFTLFMDLFLSYLPIDYDMQFFVRGGFFLVKFATAIFCVFMVKNKTLKITLLILAGITLLIWMIGLVILLLGA
ncbi:RDD family protein [Marinilabiliaceae bacterium JC017]|nr:RDD family protein [Marinilabiliaceae bacterium JC017]